LNLFRWQITKKPEPIAPAQFPTQPMPEPVKEWWQDDFDVLKKLYPHGTCFAFCGCQLTVTGFSYVETNTACAGGNPFSFTLHPRMHTVYRNSTGDLKEFVFTEHNIPLLLAKTEVKK